MAVNKPVVALPNGRRYTLRYVTAMSMELYLLWEIDAKLEVCVVRTRSVLWANYEMQSQLRISRWEILKRCC